MTSPLTAMPVGLTISTIATPLRGTSSRSELGAFPGARESNVPLPSLARNPSTWLSRIPAERLYGCATCSRTTYSAARCFETVLRQRRREGHFRKSLAPLPYQTHQRSISLRPRVLFEGARQNQEYPHCEHGSRWPYQVTWAGNAGKASRYDGCRIRSSSFFFLRYLFFLLSSQSFYLLFLLSTRRSALSVSLVFYLPLFFLST